MRRNLYAVTPELPMVPGVEVAGEIEAAGRRAIDAALRGARVAVTDVRDRAPTPAAMPNTSPSRPLRP